LDSLSVVARTEIRDVRLVGVTAKTDDVLPAEIDIEIRMTRNRYRVENGSLYVRTAAEARYLTRVSEPDTHAEDRTATETDQVEDPGATEQQKEVGRIEVELLAELDFEGGQITHEQMDEFLERSFLFIIFPYVRTTMQQTAADLRLPPTVMPYLRRNPVVTSSSRMGEGAPN
jgi:hypothetical protein